jgi:integrase
MTTTTTTTATETRPKMRGNGTVKGADAASGARLALGPAAVLRNVNGKAARPPRLTPMRDRRPRAYLTPDECDRLVKAAGGLGRHPHRDATLLTLSWRHGLRVGEAVGLVVDDVDFRAATLLVRRLKNGVDSTHYLVGAELRALRRLRRDYPGSPFLFVSERGAPLTTAAVRKIVARAGLKARIGFPVNPHALRHAFGYRAANQGHDTRLIQQAMGHRAISSTVVYTALAPGRLRALFRD